MATGVTVRNINIAVKVDSKSAMSQLERLKSALKGIGNITRDVEAAENKVKAIQNEVAKIVKATTTATTDLNKIQEKTAKSAEEMAKGMDKSAKSVGGFSKMVSRLLTYRLIREALMYITNSIKEGLDIFKKYAEVVENKRFTRAFNEISYEVYKLKANLGSLAAELVTTVEPAISAIAEAASGIVTSLSYFVSILNNSDSYFSSNNKSIKEYTKSLEEAKRSIMGFDEINKIGSDSESAFGDFYTEKEFGAVGNALKSISSFFNDISSRSLPEPISTIITTYKKIKEYLEENELTVSTVIENIKEAIEGAITWFSEKVETVKGFFDTIKGKIDEVKKAIGLDKIEEVKTTISGLIDFLADPSKFVKETAKGWLAELIKNGVESANKEVADKFVEIKTKITDIPGNIEAGINTAVSWLTDKSISIKAEITDFADDLKIKLKEIAEWLLKFPLKILLKLGIFGKDDDGKTIDDYFSSFPSASFGADSTANDLSYNAALREKFKVKAYASGGYPSAGSMFIAGEAGPEIVGSINGKTGVASGDEVTGIRTAVYSIGEAIVSAINNKDTNAVVRLDDGSIYKASQRGAKRVGNSLISFAN